MEGYWSSYRSGLCIGGGMVIRRWLYGGRMVMLEGWSVLSRENGHFTEVFTLMEGEWSCYRGSQFNGGRMVML